MGGRDSWTSNQTHQDEIVTGEWGTSPNCTELYDATVPYGTDIAAIPDRCDVDDDAVVTFFEVDADATDPVAKYFADTATTIQAINNHHEDWVELVSSDFSDLQPANYTKRE